MPPVFFFKEIKVFSNPTVRCRVGLLYYFKDKGIL